MSEPEGWQLLHIAGHIGPTWAASTPVHAAGCAPGVVCEVVVLSVVVVVVRRVRRRPILELQIRKTLEHAYITSRRLGAWNHISANDSVRANTQWGHACLGFLCTNVRWEIVVGSWHVDEP
jgi:hypothetical protein